MQLKTFSQKVLKYSKQNFTLSKFNSCATLVDINGFSKRLASFVGVKEVNGILTH